MQRMPVRRKQSLLSRVGNRHGGGLLARATQLQERALMRSSSTQRKQRGQFFTPAPVAAFMASLFHRFPKRIRVLDPGAGSGILSAAICDRILALGAPRRVEIVLYETDPVVLPVLDRCISECQEVMRAAGHDVEYVLEPRDFILANPPRHDQGLLFGDEAVDDPFDVAIMNPPYFKIAGDSAHARVMGQVVHGQPNIYTLFMAVAADLLGRRGELVAITPRSFTNGLYFRGFRRWFFERMVLRRIHLFESRKDTFRDANVLQESVITVTQRSDEPCKVTSISTSFGSQIPRSPPRFEVSASLVLDRSDPEMIVRVPESHEDLQILSVIEAWPKRFSDHGLRVSTGPVVMFRARQFLLEALRGSQTVPLLLVHNIRAFHTIWPVKRGRKPTAFRACESSRRLLLPWRNYLLLRRFSAKEERRRLTASCLLAKEALRPFVALENHINYVYHAARDLTVEEVYGLAALFNSALFDRYFRTISGNTQVNATELRIMPFPGLRTIARIGQGVIALPSPGDGAAEHIVLQELGIDGDLEVYLKEFAV